MKRDIQSLEDLDRYTKECAELFKAGDVILLEGDMGAGKTTFVRSFMSHKGDYAVSSPSFTLIQQYPSSPPVHHVDLYRLDTEVDIELLDLESLVYSGSHISFIEWPSKYSDWKLPYYRVSISGSEGEKRTISREYITTRE